MTCFRHPFLVRGTIYTRHGAFQIQRGVLDAPDAVGDDCGWVRVQDADDGEIRPLVIATRASRQPGSGSSPAQ